MGAIVALLVALMLLAVVVSFTNDAAFNEAQSFCKPHRGIQHYEPASLIQLSAHVVCKDGAAENNLGA